MQYSTNDQLPMLAPTTIDRPYWYNAGKQARVCGYNRERVHTLTNARLDLRAQNAWLDGWDYEHARILNSSGIERSKAIKAILAKRRSR